NSSRPPLLTPPTMRSLALPVEVIESVVGCCSEDTYTILAFTLTCRDLHPRSIRVLFMEVRLRNRDRLFALCDVLKARPERQPMILPQVDKEITKSLLGIGPPVTLGSFPTLDRHQTSPIVPPLSDRIHQVSLTLRISAPTEGIKHAANILAGPVAMKISTVTVFLSHDDAGR
ncbi:hypothetical protein BD311DRAFT_604180, partial [Dichomitus squalens]